MFLNKEESDRRKLIKLEEKFLKEKRKISKLPINQQKEAMEKLNEKYYVDVSKEKVDVIIRKKHDEEKLKTSELISKPFSTELQKKIERAQSRFDKDTKEDTDNYNWDDEEDSDNSFNFLPKLLSVFIPIITSLLIGLIGIGIVLMVGFMIVSQIMPPIKEEMGTIPSENQQSNVSIDDTLIDILSFNPSGVFRIFFFLIPVIIMIHFIMSISNKCRYS